MKLVKGEKSPNNKYTYWGNYKNKNIWVGLVSKDQEMNASIAEHFVDSVDESNGHSLAFSIMATDIYSRDGYVYLENRIGGVYMPKCDGTLNPKLTKSGYLGLPSKAETAINILMRKKK